MKRKYISNKDETIRMFDNSFLELFSRVHPSVPVILYVPVIIYLLYNTFVRHAISYEKIFSLFVVGILVWSMTEYLLHRFLFHYEPKSKMGERVHFIFHGVHHDYPNDSRRLVMPPSVSIPLALIFYIVYLKILGMNYIFPFYAGFLTGYLCYDMIHYSVHHLRSNNRLFLAIKKHHMRHHYMDDTKGFGVSQPVWDKVLRTDFKDKGSQ